MQKKNKNKTYKKINKCLTLLSIAKAITTTATTIATTFH